ncbi:MAG: LPS biosynthesis protein [Armatimonadetes bacterium CG_4_10_14_3_um_filter_66_18]|nr:LPS biosynthesis protein [Armatimonadota bacterium]PIU92717.1 MAG: LPS biosynthesis protein [Armatimonadetes bacterium CG06_land_8_20_14_3_00_66_21]PIX45161.1 MAG: LPS biosynthesis protein [Armatimonadetes bacterium CG_4_8_14_3_um_filter_66_20]PIY54323.1 MAG: LPS biosynthesis protein [Armatimonadetes bacterium CG_4_10_14_3_um_filter_66_18]PIZ47880.1 MAG: LPS biosynthesis protein [Armatimonadetes bacterium CG_4_10_14_0_8_um_filter_66_14]PJB70719.1 MAG: LPS biosynthesis protein [Armatimonadet
MIDSHPREVEAMALFKEGRGGEARRLQEAFLEEVLTSGEDLCSCPSDCKYPGKCVECVLVHRGHADHLPHCFRAMVNKRLAELSGLTEHSLEGQAGT